MSKGQKGNKEAKKPKKTQGPPLPAGAVPPSVAVVAPAPARLKRN
jgi:hypothetical protein